MTPKEIFLEFIELCPIKYYKSVQNQLVIAYVLEDQFKSAIKVLQDRIHLNIQSWRDEIWFTGDASMGDIVIKQIDGTWVGKKDADIVATGSFKKCALAVGVADRVVQAKMASYKEVDL
jgi:hypothetical protein